MREGMSQSLAPGLRFGCISMAFFMSCMSTSQYVETAQLRNLAPGQQRRVQDTSGAELELTSEDTLFVQLRGDREIVVSGAEVRQDLLIGTLIDTLSYGQVVKVPLA